MKKSVILSVFLGLALAVSPALFGTPSTAHADTQCVITSFTANPTSINTGGSATLNWTTYGCNAFGVHLGGGTFMSYSYMPSNGTVTTGPLTGTTTYTLYADGSNSSTNRTTTVYVNGGAYPYTYQCSDGIDNDGNGLIDYPADPGCTSPYDNDESGAYGTNTNRALVAITTPASNVGATSARLNGGVANATSSYVSFFEYGTDYLILDRATTLQTYGPFTNSISDTIVTTPGTLYYYRVVARTGNSVYRGEVHSFSSLASDTATYPTGSSSSSTTSGNQSGSQSSSNSASSNQTTSGTANAITLTITNKDDAINVGDLVENTITYTNNTTKTLKKATITVSLPQGFTIKQTTEGNITNPTTLTDSIASIAPGQTGSIFLEAIVGANTQINATLVTNGTLAYTLPNGTSDSVVGYVINHASVQNVFAGFALGSGFFPTTIFGWLITVIIILTLILIARRIAKSKHTHGHGGHGGHGDAHGDGHDAPKH